MSAHALEHTVRGDEREGPGPCTHDGFDHIPGGDTGGNDYWRKRNLLSLDGGGVRGFLGMLGLQKIVAIIEEEEEQEEEQRLAREEQEAAKVQEDGENTRDSLLTSHYFDVIGSTRTGSLIAIMLSRFRMTVHECLEEYESISQKIFGKPRLVSARSDGQEDDILPSRFRTQPKLDEDKMTGLLYCPHRARAESCGDVCVMATVRRHLKRSQRVGESMYKLRKTGRSVAVGEEGWLLGNMETFADKNDRWSHWQYLGGALVCVGQMCMTVPIAMYSASRETGCHDGYDTTDCDGSWCVLRTNIESSLLPQAANLLIEPTTFALAYLAFGVLTTIQYRWNETNVLQRPILVTGLAGAVLASTYARPTADALNSLAAVLPVAIIFCLLLSQLAGVVGRCMSVNVDEGIELRKLMSVFPGHKLHCALGEKA